jgi:hypothetical protein
MSSFLCLLTFAAALLLFDLLASTLHTHLIDLKGGTIGSKASPSPSFMVSIVIPTYTRDQVPFESLLISLSRYCIDCNRAQIVVVVTTEQEVTDFRASVMQNAAISSAIQMQLTFIRLDTILFGAGISFNHSDIERAISRGHVGKHLIQSMKKLYGCLHAGVDWCFATDSESRMIRRAHLAEFVNAYSRHPSTWHNSLYVPGCGHRIAGRCLPGEAPLGYHAGVTVGRKFLFGSECSASIQEIGYAMEVYHWLFERRILVAFVDFLQAHDATLPGILWAAANGDFEGKIFIEEAYYHFIACFRTHYAEYTFIDVADIVRAGRNETDTAAVLALTGVTSFGEVLGIYIKSVDDTDRALLLRFAHMLRFWNIPTFSAASGSDPQDVELSVEFLRKAGTIVCTSWCSDAVLDAFDLLNFPAE